MDELQTQAAQVTTLNSIPVEMLEDSLGEVIEQFEMCRHGGTISITINEYGEVTLSHKYPNGMKHEFEVAM